MGSRATNRRADKRTMNERRHLIAAHGGCPAPILYQQPIHFDTVVRPGEYATSWETRATARIEATYGPEKY